jgi:hypothetical protein
VSRPLIALGAYKRRHGRAQSDPADAVGLGLSTVVDFERRRVSASAIQAISEALVARGVEFIDENAAVPASSSESGTRRKVAWRRSVLADLDLQLAGPNLARPAKAETSFESERALAEERLGSAGVLEFVHGYRHHALERSYCPGEPRTRRRRHACGSAFYRLPQAPCRACRSASSPHSADSPALRECYDDARPLLF